MRTSLSFVLALVTLAALPAAAQQIPYTRIELDNGLQVLLHEDPALPLVTVNLMYRYGSRDEAEGNSGYAHLAEHLMFMGTERVPEGAFDQIMESGGGWNNAWTGDDATDYYDVGPSSLLPTLLWLEADRLERIGVDMDQTKLDLQRDVVRNERRQNYENEPYGKVWLVVPELMYPPGHPYAHSGIGSHEDLIATTVEDIVALYDAGYDPANASLVVAGDFDAAATEALIRSLFEDLPSAGAPMPRADAGPVTLPAAVRLTVEDRVELPRVYLLWHSPALYAAGDAELDLLGSILDADKIGRLSRALMIDSELAQDVTAAQFSASLGSMFAVIATCREGVAPADVEAAIDAQLRRLVAEGPTDDEVTRARNQWEASFVASLQSVHARAMKLNAYWLDAGDPGFLEQDLARYQTPDAARLREVAAQVLVDERLSLWVVPEGAGDGAVQLPPWLDAVPADAFGPVAVDEAGADTAADSGADAATPDEAADDVDDAGDADAAGSGAGAGADVDGADGDEARPRPPSPRDNRPDDLPVVDWLPPAAERFTLANGLDVWHLQRDTIPMLQLALVLPTGSHHDPAGHEGLAMLTADLLDEGAGRRDATELAGAVEMLGASLYTWAEREATVIAMGCLRRTVDDALALLADVAIRPRMAAKDFDRVHGLAEGALAQRAQNPRAVAAVAGFRTLFGDGHPYASPTGGTRASLEAISLADVRRLQRGAYRPDRATLVVVGDTAGMDLRTALDEAFGGWKARRGGGHDAAPPPAPAYTAWTETPVVLVDRPGAAQTALQVLMPADDEGTEQWVANELLNSTLGGTFTSRLMANLREDKGWTYGIGSYWAPYDHAGVIGIGTAVAAEHTADALDEIFAELAALREHGVRDDELGKSSRSYRNDTVETYGSLSSVALELVALAIDKLPADTPRDRAEQASALTVDELASRAADQLRPDRAVIVLVGDRASLTAQLAAAGYAAPTILDEEGRPLPAE